MHLNSIRWIDVHGLEEPARCVGADGDGAEVERPILLTNLLEGSTVAGVPSKPEALCPAQDCPAAPQRLVLVSEARPGAGVLQWHGTPCNMLIMHSGWGLGQCSHHAVMSVCTPGRLAQFDIACMHEYSM